MARPARSSTWCASPVMAARPLDDVEHARCRASPRRARRRTAAARRPAAAPSVTTSQAMASAASQDAELAGEVDGGAGLVAEDEGGERDQQLGEGDDEQHVAGPLAGGCDGHRGGRHGGGEDGLAEIGHGVGRADPDAAVERGRDAAERRGSPGSRRGAPRSARGAARAPPRRSGRRSLPGRVGTTCGGGRRDGSESSRQTGLVDETSRLALAAGHGDRAALASFVRRTQGEVWRLCAALSDRASADDLTQETYLRAIGVAARASGATRRPARGCWPSPGAPAPTTCAAGPGPRRLVRPGAGRGPGAGRRPTRRAGWSSTRSSPALEPGRREAFVLTQVLGLDYAEAAEVCGCPIGTIRSRVARARADLAASGGAGRRGRGRLRDDRRRRAGPAGARDPRGRAALALRRGRRSRRSARQHGQHPGRAALRHRRLADARTAPAGPAARPRSGPRCGSSRPVGAPRPATGPRRGSGSRPAWPTRWPSSPPGCRPGPPGRPRSAASRPSAASPGARPPAAASPRTTDVRPRASA